jgi:tetratricopeptide (TPR) repeat protein
MIGYITGAILLSLHLLITLLRFKGFGLQNFDLLPFGFIILGTTFLLNYFISIKEDRIFRYWWQNIIGGYLIITALLDFFSFEKISPYIKIKKEIVEYFLFFGVIILIFYKYRYIRKQNMVTSMLTKRIDSNSANDYYNRGISYHHRRLYDEAIVCYSKAIEMNPPKLYEVYNNRGLVYFEKCLYDQAIYDFTRAIELSSGIALMYYNRALAYNKKGFYDKAIADYDKALEIDPTYVDAIYNKALSYEENDYIKEAIESYQQFLNVASSHYNREIKIAKQRLNLLLKKQRSQKNSGVRSLDIR